MLSKGELRLSFFTSKNKCGYKACSWPIMHSVITFTEYMEKFCKNCNALSARYADGRCKVCVSRRNLQWQRENKDKVLANSRLYNTRHWLGKRELAESYRARMREEINARRRERRAKDPDKDRVYGATRRARKRASGGTLSPDIVKRLFALQNGLCACCGVSLSGRYHLDHIMPLALGGSNTDNNVQLLLPKCNLQKYTLHPDIFIKRKSTQPK